MAAAQTINQKWKENAQTQDADGRQAFIYIKTQPIANEFF